MEKDVTYAAAVQWQADLLWVRNCLLLLAVTAVCYVDAVAPEGCAGWVVLLIGLPSIAFFARLKKQQHDVRVAVGKGGKKGQQALQDSIRRRTSNCIFWIALLTALLSVSPEGVAGWLTLISGLCLVCGFPSWVAFFSSMVLLLAPEHVVACIVVLASVLALMRTPGIWRIRRSFDCLDGGGALIDEAALPEPLQHVVHLFPVAPVLAVLLVAWAVPEGFGGWVVLSCSVAGLDLMRVSKVAADASSIESALCQLPPTGGVEARRLGSQASDSAVSEVSRSDSDGSAPGSPEDSRLQLCCVRTDRSTVPGSGGGAELARCFQAGCRTPSCSSLSALAVSAKPRGVVLQCFAWCDILRQRWQSRSTACIGSTRPMGTNVRASCARCMDMLATTSRTSEPESALLPNRSPAMLQHGETLRSRTPEFRQLSPIQVDVMTSIDESREESPNGRSDSSDQLAFPTALVEDDVPSVEREDDAPSVGRCSPLLGQSKGMGTFRAFFLRIFKTWWTGRGVTIWRCCVPLSLCSCRCSRRAVFWQNVDHAAHTVACHDNWAAVDVRAASVESSVSSEQVDCAKLRRLAAEFAVNQAFARAAMAVQDSDIRRAELETDLHAELPETAHVSPFAAILETGAAEAEERKSQSCFVAELPAQDAAQALTSRLDRCEELLTMTQVRCEELQASRTAAEAAITRSVLAEEQSRRQAEELAEKLKKLERASAEAEAMPRCAVRVESPPPVRRQPCTVVHHTICTPQTTPSTTPPPFDDHTPPLTPPEDAVERMAMRLDRCEALLLSADVLLDQKLAGVPKVTSIRTVSSQDSTAASQLRSSNLFFKSATVMLRTPLGTAQCILQAWHRHTLISKLGRLGAASASASESSSIPASSHASPLEEQLWSTASCFAERHDLRIPLVGWPNSDGDGLVTFRPDYEEMLWVTPRSEVTEAIYSFRPPEYVERLRALERQAGEEAQNATRVQTELRLMLAEAERAAARRSPATIAKDTGLIALEERYPAAKPQRDSERSLLRGMPSPEPEAEAGCDTSPVISGLMPRSASGPLALSAQVPMLPTYLLPRSGSACEEQRSRQVENTDDGESQTSHSGLQLHHRTASCLDGGARTNTCSPS